MIKTENKITKTQKRAFYITLVMILLAGTFTLFYLIFILINTQNRIIELDDKTNIAIGSILAILGIMFGNPVGKKWWHLVYEERQKGAFLKVKK